MVDYYNLHFHFHFSYFSPLSEESEITTDFSFFAFALTSENTVSNGFNLEINMLFCHEVGVEKQE